MHIEVVETACLGNRCYVAINGSDAVVVDPPRDIDRVEDVLHRHDARAVVVAETHRHADYVSGGLELSRRHRAAYLLPSGDPQPRFAFVPATEGEVLEAGRLGIRPIFTPGHTPHHVSYVLAEAGVPIAVCTGGSLLNGSVGRTDLHGPELTVPLAHEQWRSVRRLLEELPHDVLLLPTHGFGSLCSAAPASATASATLGDERGVNPALLVAEAPFVAALVDGYGPIPRHYERLPLLNAAGPPPVDVSPPALLEAGDLLRLREQGHWVVDVRDRRSYAAEHLAGTVNIEVTGPLVAYLPWLLPPGAGVVLLGDPVSVWSATRQLTQVGVDRPLGAMTGTPWDWSDGDPRLVRTYNVSTFAGFEHVRERSSAVALDVRSQQEWNAGRVRDALNLPLPALAELADPSRPGIVPPIPDDTWVYCGGGFRAAIATSLLDSAGVTVTLIDQPFQAAVDAGLTRDPCAADPYPRTGSRNDGARAG